MTPQERDNKKAEILREYEKKKNEINARFENEKDKIKSNYKKTHEYFKGISDFITFFTGIK